ncbi:MAG: hypothetical protein GDA49_01490 [Rhodospirillales bacterium]|nr:hypothetical protein [Rhodospirillales bacterium]
MYVRHADLEQAALLQMMAEEILAAGDPTDEQTLRAEEMHGLAATLILRSDTACLGNDLL